MKYYLGEFDEKAGGECSTSLSKDITKIDFDKDDDELDELSLSELVTVLLTIDNFVSASLIIDR